MSVIITNMKKLLYVKDLKEVLNEIPDNYTLDMGEDFTFVVDKKYETLSLTDINCTEEND